MAAVRSGAGKLLCLRRDEKAGAMFLFERITAKGKNREARPKGIFRQKNNRRGIPPPRPFRKNPLKGGFFIFNKSCFLIKKNYLCLSAYLLFISVN